MLNNDPYTYMDDRLLSILEEINARYWDKFLNERRR